MMASQDHTANTLGRKSFALLLLLGVVFYCATAQRGYSWQDSGEYQWRCIQNDYLESIPAARSHPLYILIGNALYRVAGEGAFFFVLNAFSGCMMAVALAVLAATMARLGICRAVTVAIWLTLLLAHAIWWLSTIAEVYTFSAALLSLEIYALVRLLQEKDAKWLYLLFFANGLHLSVHNMAVLALPVYVVALFVYAKPKKFPVIVKSAACWLVGAAGFIAILIIQISQLGLIDGVVDCLVGRYGSEVLNVGGLSKNYVENFALLSLNFCNLLLPLAVVALFRIFRKPWNRPGVFIAVIALIEFVFLIRYNVPDQFTFSMLTLITFGLLAAIGANWLAQRFSKKWIVGLIILTAVAQPVAFSVFNAVVGKKISRPTHSAVRQEGRYWLCPWKNNENSAEQWAESVANLPSPKAVFVNRTAYYPLVLAGLDGSVQVRCKELEKIASRGDRKIYLSYSYEVPEGWRVVKDIKSLRLREVTDK